MESAGIQGFFTNHSARRTGGTYLFRAGVKRKVVKDTTGHSSDAIDQYQITSDKQRQMMSEILTSQHKNQVSEVALVSGVETKRDNEEKDVKSAKSETCSCTINQTNVGAIIDEFIKKQPNEVIKIRIEIIKE